MNYKEKYFEIINSGYKTKPVSGYYERHHIIPKSICPLLKKSQNNLIYLTAKNHFLAHYYIWKWFKDELHETKWSNKMCYAFNMMKRIIVKTENIDELSKLYDEVRIQFIKLRKGKKHTEEARRKISNATKGEKNGMYGKKISDETRKKLIESHKGKKLSEELKRKLIESRNKPILQFNKSGIFLREWKSAAEAGNELGIHKGHISNCCTGKRKSAGSFVWKYKYQK